jgi:hypothetical protein
MMSALNRLKRILTPMVGMMFIGILTGCYTATTVNHDSPNYTRPSEQSAIDLISGRRGRLPMSDVFPYIKTVDYTGFEYWVLVSSNGSVINANLALLLIPGVIGDELYVTSENAAKAKNGKFVYLGRVNFKDISKLELITFPHSNDSAIRLYCDHETIKYFDILCRKDKPELNDALLAALLVLCPNVK